jgi:hypothetical protein
MSIQFDLKIGCDTRLGGDSPVVGTRTAPSGLSKRGTLSSTTSERVSSPTANRMNHFLYNQWKLQVIYPQVHGEA